MNDAIVVTAIAASGRHGVFDWERENPQPFEVDLEIDIDLAVAGKSDDLADTLDYSSITRDVVAIVSTKSFQLVERLGEEIAAMVLECAKVRGVTVTVRKMQPPIGEDVAHVGVRITRPR